MTHTNWQPGPNYKTFLTAEGLSLAIKREGRAKLRAYVVDFESMTFEEIPVNECVLKF